MAYGESWDLPGVPRVPNPFAEFLIDGDEFENEPVPPPHRSIETFAVYHSTATGGCGRHCGRIAVQKNPEISGSPRIPRPNGSGLPAHEAAPGQPRVEPRAEFRGGPELLGQCVKNPLLRVHLHDRTRNATRTLVRPSVVLGGPVRGVFQAVSFVCGGDSVLPRARL